MLANFYSKYSTTAAYITFNVCLFKSFLAVQLFFRKQIRAFFIIFFFCVSYSEFRSVFPKEFFWLFFFVCIIQLNTIIIPFFMMFFFKKFIIRHESRGFFIYIHNRKTENNYLYRLSVTQKSLFGVSFWKLLHP